MINDFIMLQETDETRSRRGRERVLIPGKRRSSHLLGKQRNAGQKVETDGTYPNLFGELYF